MSQKIKEAEKIFGPPGTGKTDRLIKKVSHLINEKVSSQRTSAI